MQVVAKKEFLLNFKNSGIGKSIIRVVSRIFFEPGFQCEEKNQKRKILQKIFELFEIRKFCLRPYSMQPRRDL